MPEYSRRGNTDNYYQRTDRQLTTAAQLLRDLENRANTFDEIVERDRAVSNWLASSRTNLEAIYTDEEVFNDLKAETGIDLNELSHQEILETLRREVRGRIAILNEIREQTRIYDGRQ